MIKRIPWNKGKTNPQQRIYMKTHNPMKGKIGALHHLYGKKWTKESKDKLSRSRTGLKCSAKSSLYGTNIPNERKEKIRKSIALKRENGWNPLKGKKQSLSTKLKRSLSQKGRIFTSEHKAKIKLARMYQQLPFKDSKPEKIMQEELNKRNILFKKHVPLIGQPDIFIEPNICIFCDGDYWHANPEKFLPTQYISRGNTAKDIWKKDWNVTKTLIESNYFVFRFWASEIEKDITLIGDKIENLLK